MADTKKVKVGQATTNPINLGSYSGTGDYQGISFNLIGEIAQNSHWTSHFLKNLKLDVISASVRCNLFMTKWCRADKKLEVHIATGDSQLMPRTDYDANHVSTALDELNLDPNDSNAKVKIQFVVYAYNSNNPNDDKIQECGNPTSTPVPVYQIRQSFDKIIGVEAFDPGTGVGGTPDTKDGNIIIGT